MKRIPRMATILALALLLPAAARAVDIGYRFELLPGDPLRMFVHVDLAGSDAGMTVLTVNDEWGGVRGGGEDFLAVTAATSAGLALPVERTSPSRVVVRHTPGEGITVSFLIEENDYQVSDDHFESRRPILNEGLFRTVGHLGLPRPDHIDSAAPLEVYFRWDGFEEAGWKVVSSFGVGASERVVKATLDDVAEGLYLAGDVKVITRDIHGSPLTITVAGDAWGFTSDEFADVCARITEVERGFFDDYDRGFYWISLVPVGPPKETGYSIGGTGLTNCFSLSVYPNAVMDTGTEAGTHLVRTIAHEMFHDWNGQIIGREDPEELVYWFSEGFTDFFTRRLLYRGGLIDAKGYAESASLTIERYLTSPFRDEPNSRIHRDFWNDPDVQKLPYYRGDIVAMIMDLRIREHSDGKQSLDGLMREVVDEGREGHRVSTDGLLVKFAAWAGQEASEEIRGIVESGAPVEIPTDLFAPCLEAQTHDVWAYDVGFDLQASTDGLVVTGVREGSAAWTAGLRDGMPLEGWSVHRGNTSEPVSFQVLDGGEKRDIEYLPRGDIFQVYRFVPVPGASCDHL